MDPEPIGSASFCRFRSSDPYPFQPNRYTVENTEIYDTFDADEKDEINEE